MIGQPAQQLQRTVRGVTACKTKLNRLKILKSNILVKTKCVSKLPPSISCEMVANDLLKVAVPWRGPLCCPLSGIWSPETRGPSCTRSRSTPRRAWPRWHESGRASQTTRDQTSSPYPGSSSTPVKAEQITSH